MDCTIQLLHSWSVPLFTHMQIVCFLMRGLNYDGNNTMYISGIFCLNEMQVFKKKYISLQGFVTVTIIDSRTVII